MFPRLVKELNVVGKINNSPSIIGGLFGGFQRRDLSLVLVKDNKASRRVALLGLRKCKILRNKVVVKWASQLALVHCIV